MTEEKMKELLEEIKQNCATSIKQGVVYEDENADEKTMAINFAIHLIEDLIEKEKKSKNNNKNNKIKYNIRYKANGELIEKKNMTWEEVQEFIDGLERQKESELEVKKIKEIEEEER